jgi:sodium pump decarboxylase gamma subunit
MQNSVSKSDAEFAEAKSSADHYISIGKESAETGVIYSALSAYRDNLEDIGDVEPLDDESMMKFVYGMGASGSIPEYYYTAGEDDGVVAHMMIVGSKHNAAVEFYYNKYNELTNVNVSVQLALGESMQKAGVNTLIGMGTVFAMLILIMFIISAMKIIPTMQEAMAKKKEENKGSEASIDNTIAGIIERETAEADSDELIAVIAAAIAAASAESGETGDFVVRSIRRVR